MRAMTGFEFIGRNHEVGGAAGVAPITDVVGDAVDQIEVRNTRRMLDDNAAKAEAEAREVAAQKAATEEAIQAEVERRVAAQLAQQPPLRAVQNQEAEANNTGGAPVHRTDLVNAMGQIFQGEMGDILMMNREMELSQQCAYAGNPVRCVEMQMQDVREMRNGTWGR